MKKQLLLTLLFFGALLGTLLFSSYKSSVEMFGKTVFPITEVIDKAWGKTDLNGHLKGDSSSGYEIWGRNKYGTDFKLAGAYVQTELYTDNLNLSVSDSSFHLDTILRVKKITPRNLVKFNNISLSCNPNTTNPINLVVYVLDSALKVVFADTVATEIDNNTFVHTWSLKEIVTLKPNITYYVGIYCNLQDKIELCGNGYALSGPDYVFDSTWVTYNAGLTAPAIGDTISISALQKHSINMLFYLE